MWNTKIITTNPLYNTPNISISILLPLHLNYLFKFKERESKDFFNKII